LNTPADFIPAKLLATPFVSAVLPDDALDCSLFCQTRKSYGYLFGTAFVADSEHFQNFFRRRLSRIFIAIGNQEDAGRSN
jgi:hypothetical protein